MYISYTKPDGERELKSVDTFITEALPQEPGLASLVSMMFERKLLMLEDVIEITQHEGSDFGLEEL